MIVSVIYFFEKVLLQQEHSILLIHILLTKLIERL